MNPTAMPPRNPGHTPGGSQPPHSPGVVPQPLGHQAVHPHVQPVQPQPVAQPSPVAQDFTQPVAYDVQGRPLYLHPQQAAQSQPQPQQPPQPQMVYMSRPMQPEAPVISDEVRQRHDDSRKKHPHLNLSDGEYILSAVKRHPIGLLRIWAAAALIMILFSAMAAMFIFSPDAIFEDASTMLGVGLVLLYIIVLLGAFAATYIYDNNRFYLTNESVIQEIQTSLFDKHEQTVSLGNIEDASYKQVNFIQTLFNYGSIRLSTEGDETTYRFDYVAAPKKHIAMLNNAVESFKNGRPVE